MKNLHFCLLFSLSLSVGYFACAQEFNNRRSLNLGIENNSHPPSSLAIPKVSNERMLLKYRVDKTKPEEGDIGFLPKSNMKSAKDLLEETQYEKGTQSIEEFMRNQNFGSIVTGSAFVNILCRDHENVDGDMIAIYVNDKVVVPGMVLEAGFRGFNIPLEKGFNKIDFVAINEGFYAPNTAEFEVYDDNRATLFAERWILAKGFKATILLVKN